MSEQYYTQEDELKDTPAQALENYQAQANSLANLVPEVAVALQQTGEALGQLYDQAQTRGDAGAMALISASWQRTEQIANSTVQLDALKQSAATAIQTINEERQRVATALDELEDAISDGDERHPALQDYASAIREDEAAFQQELAGEADLEYAFEVTYDNLMENLKELTGLEWRSINRFIGILQGDYEISELQSAQLRAFIEGLEMERDGAE